MWKNNQQAIENQHILDNIFLVNEEQLKFSDLSKQLNAKELNERETQKKFLKQIFFDASTPKFYDQWSIAA